MNLCKSTSLLTCLGAAGVSLLLAGCGKKLDMDLVNKSISDGIASQLGLADAVVTCPQEAPPAKAGESFECEAKPKEGGLLVLKVTQKDDKGDVTWELARIEGMVNLKAAEESITTGLKGQGVDATVTCVEEGGTSLRAATVGETFNCHAETADGSSRTVVLTMKDNDGTTGWALEQPAGEATEEPAETSEEPEAQ